MSYSASIKLRRPARTDGTCQILLLAVIHRKPHPLGLGIGWFPELFDEKDGRCLASVPKRARPEGYDAALRTATAWAGGTAEALEKKAADYNLIIGKALSKANDVFVDFRLSGQPVTSEGFLYAYNTEGSKKDFIVYMERKIAERYRKGKGHRDGISEITKKNHTSSLNALKEFRPTLPFFGLHAKFADDFDAFLRKRIKSVNTIWGRHKDVKAYLSLARKDRIKFEDPYQDSAPGQWKPLKPGEQLLLDAYYQQCAPRTPQRRILAKFLFSCCSSLRLSDLKGLRHARLEGQELHFRIYKTYDKKLREMMLPLTKKALSYLEDAEQEEGMPGFYHYTDQYSNRALKIIAQHVGVETRLHHHVGRETFATEFIRRGGKVEVLQKLMDHEKIATTMKYVHVDNDMKRDAIKMLDALDDIPLMKVG
ncbi:tyrosine-type recombinase/integrase [Hymenobacter defluvii]|uniref:Site-specific integrase n=1 Tax=Hymenobacter defluvii TaxID=2054411 RepID=A0ABS3TFT8_9BACT|nr:site-specific integrase [Hymenobacter defluvii]MBO3272243.1 site-specific integrase [Hymenobacter defluvii]